MIFKIKTKEDLEKVADMARIYATIEWPYWYWEIEVLDDKHIKIKCTIEENSCEFDEDFIGTYDWYQLADRIRAKCQWTQACASGALEMY